jgi:hypothetical protein
VNQSVSTRVMPSDVVMVYVGGRLVGSWRPTRWRRRLVPHLLTTPEWTRPHAAEALTRMRSAAHATAEVGRMRESEPAGQEVSDATP